MTMIVVIVGHNASIIATLISGVCLGLALNAARS